MKNIPQYRSSKSVAKNRTVPIAADDPRLSWDKIGQTKSILGSDIDYIGLDGKMLIAGGTSINNPGGASISGKSVPGSTETQQKDLLPQGIENLTAEWSNDDIVLTFDFDATDSQNVDLYKFLVKIKDQSNGVYYQLMSGVGYGGSFLSTNSASQTLTLKNSDIQRSGIELSQNINKVAIASTSLYQTNEYVEADLAPYVSPLPKPSFTLSKGVDYYVVTMDSANLTEVLSKVDSDGNKLFYGIIVEEKVTTETVKANVSLTTGWVQSQALTTNAVSVIYTPDGAHRWVRVKYIGKSGNGSVYSEIADITPDPFMPVNTDPPTNFNTATIAWQGNDIKVTFVRPSTNAGTVIKVKLVPYVNDTESTTFYGFYYKTLDALDTEFLIKSLDIYGQFGTYYSKFKAYVTALSAQGVESGTTISAGPITRSNPLASIYPTAGTPNVNSPTGIFRATPIANGYVVDFDMPVGATKLEVYEKATAWTVVPTNDDEMVYAGLSPATIITPDNDTRYVIVRYYDQFDNTSYYSMELTGQTSGVEVNPLDIGTLSLIENPIKIQTDGSIFAGVGNSTQYPQVFFNKDGLFAYDASGNWTTEIINSAETDEPTFITKRATIGDWTISPTAIQNDGYVSGSTYTGLSASGTYSFWAGSGTSKNSDGSANFSVTPAGVVTAKKISIVGDGTSSDLINAGSGVFKVTNTGALTASSATITGSITVNQQSYFNANINIGSSAYLIATGTGTVKLGDEGILAINAGGVATTKLYSSPITVGTTTGVSFWSRKALFGSTESSGWLIDDGVIKSTYVTMDSEGHEIKVVSKTNNANGISITAGYDTDYAIKSGNLSSPSFWVKHNGDLYASNAEITGTINAVEGYIGSNTVGWAISENALAAIGEPDSYNSVIDLGYGVGYITVGDYSILANASGYFTIYESSTGKDLVSVDAASANGRLILGYEDAANSRQVEVAKSAQIAGSTVNSLSGGLRNMYTIGSNYYTSSIYSGTAKTGDVLLVWE
jgi:hypothetical protein